MQSTRILFQAILIISVVKNVFAFNPPVDTVGTLTARIEGPETITEVGVPQPVKVVLENSGQHDLQGTVRLAVIDDWTATPETTPFRVSAGASSTISFQVTAGKQTYAALYPIHAFVNLAGVDPPQTAHPILIVNAQVPAPTIPESQLTWQPWRLSSPRKLALWQLPIHRSVLTVFGKDPLVMPVGWAGSEAESRGSVVVRATERLGDQTREVVSIHPPWFNGQIGTAWIEYPLALPESTPIRLRFANAVTPSGEGDGVTFRVRVASFEAEETAPGEIVFERHSNAKAWEEADVDLSRFAGRTIRLQLESHPGPKNNTAFDQAFWAEPTLQIGEPAVTKPFPPKDLQDSLALGVIHVGDESYDVRVWPGSRGLLDASIGFLTDKQQLYFRGFRLRVMGQRLDDAASTVELVSATREASAHGLQYRHCFESIEGTLEIVTHLYVENDTLRTAFRLEKAPPRRAWFAPHIEELSINQFSHDLEQVYAGHGNVIQQPGPFHLSFDGHRLATSHVGFNFDQSISLLQAVDLPPDSLKVEPDNQHYSLSTAHDATFTLIPAANVWQAAKKYRETNGLRAAGGVKKLAGRFVFDLWGGRYGESGELLQKAFRYGLTDSAVIWHNWQRWGYDYRLPEIYPPNPAYGSEQELAAMTDACRASGVLFALHDNYVDFYPDAAGFSYRENIAFHGDGRPVRAWFNQGREAQSYRYRADRIDPYLKSNLRKLAEKLPPTAYFIDVWSSARPYDYWTATGEFFDRVSTRERWGEHFAWIRDLLGDNAPQISESGHDQLIGWLDGAQANHLRVGEPTTGYYKWAVWDIDCEDAERTPWFDFAHHDRFILHGAGYSDRYQAGLDARLHGMYSDDYIATEVLTGHPSMVSRPFDRDVVRKYWLTQDLMRALAMRTIEQVEYVDGDLHKQHIRWSGDGDVWVNRGKSDWTVDGITLPQYGLLAKVATSSGIVRTTICRRDEVLVEIAQSPKFLYLNGRQVVDRVLRIQPRVETLTGVQPRRIDLTILWQADDPIPEGYQPFVHFVDAEGEILFQAGHRTEWSTATSDSAISMSATAHLPEDLKIGDRVELRVGLYSPEELGRRLPIRGESDGQGRVRVGTIELTGDDGQVRGVQWSLLATEPDPYLARQNSEARQIDFGSVVTAGGCRLSVEDQDLMLIPLPDSGKVASTYTIRWDRLPWKLPSPKFIEAIDEQGNVLRRQVVEQPLVLTAKEDVFAFRVKTGD